MELEGCKIQKEKNCAMINKFKKHRRFIWGLLTAILAFAFVTLMGQQSLSSNDLSDAAKHQKVESLYDGY